MICKFYIHNLHYNVHIFIQSGYVLYNILILGGENRGREVLTALCIEDCGAGGRALAAQAAQRFGS